MIIKRRHFHVSSTLAATAVLSLALIVSQPVAAFAFDDESTAAVNLDRAKLALRGYDPVAYFTVGKPTPGRPEFATVHDGATYRFETADARDAFVTEPAKYVPQYGGFCAWAVSQGYKADADPTAWKIVDGRLYVNYNASVQRSWVADATALIKTGDTRWAGIAPKAPKQLK